MSLTLRELASQLNLSPTTVSDALKDVPTGYVAPATRERVRQEADRLGYRPNPHARRLTRQRADNVAVLFSSVRWFAGPLPVKVNLIQDALSTAGYEVAFHRAARPNTGATREALASFVAQRPGLILLNAYGLNNKPLFEEAAHYLAAGNGALVIFDEVISPTLRALLPSNGWDEVVFDREANTRLAVEHLLKLGHQHLGLFLNQDNVYSGERTEGAHAALIAAGRDLERNVTFYPIETFAGFETGAIIARHWLSEKPGQRPTGMVLLNDETAAGFITEVRAAGIRVPEDVSVVGHDASPWGAHLPVPLTTVTHPSERIATSVIETAQTRLSLGSDAPTRHIVIGSELIVRASSAAPPNQGKRL